VAEFFEQLVHEREEELALRTEVLVEAADGEVGTADDVVDGGSLVAIFTEEGQGSGFQASAFFEAALLKRLGREIFTGEEIGASLHARFLAGISAPTKAPAQQMSIHPPKAPAASGGMFGKTSGKKALENGSRTSVGSAREMAPAGHWSGGRREARQSRRASKAIRKKLMAKKARITKGRPGWRRPSPRRRRMRVAAIQMAKP